LIYSYNWKSSFVKWKAQSLCEQGRTRGGPAPPPRPPLRVPPLRGWWGASMGKALLILHLLAFPFLRSGTVVYLGGICLNSLLIQGEKSVSLLKRILHYTRCTMTESRLNDLALIYSFTLCLSSLLKKVIEMFVQANPRKF